MVEIRSHKSRYVLIGALVGFTLCLHAALPERSEAAPSAHSPEGKYGENDVPNINGTPTPTPTPTRTPTRTPTPTPTPPCPYVMASIKRLGDGGYNWGRGALPSAYNMMGKKAKLMSCIQSLYNDEVFGPNKSVNNAYEDDVYAYSLGKYLFPDRDKRGAVKIGTQSNGAVCESLETRHLFVQCANGYAYLDSNCKVVPASQLGGQSIPDGCTFAVNFYESSPISLILDEAQWRESASTLTRFPLARGVTDAWYSWKASSSAPLLVYDPEHKGSITEATQLFGEWTFGGQRVAARDRGEVGVGTTPMPWKNGFEALATLDHNGDGRISDQELQPLALWFDANRDGISQEGEVHDLARHGITALYFEPDHTQPGSRDIFVTRGFERRIGNEVTMGRAVDWYAKRSGSQFDFIDTYPSKAFDRTDSASVPSIEEVLESSEPSEIAAQSSAKGPLSGIWEWRAQQPSGGDEAIADGYLVFSDGSADGKIRGISLTERALGMDGKQLEGRSLLSMFSLVGSRSPAANGAVSVEFRVLGNGQEDGVVSSTAVLSPEGLLTGTTTVTKAGTKIEYSWIAKRVPPPPSDAQ